MQKKVWEGWRWEDEENWLASAEKRGGGLCLTPKPTEVVVLVKKKYYQSERESKFYINYIKMYIKYNYINYIGII